MTIEESIAWATSVLRTHCERPQLEAELLLAHHLNCDRIYLITHAKERVEALERYKALVGRREKDEPYEYIVGEVSFYDIHLAVESGVLIPRPETEILVDLVADMIEKKKITQIAEIGVGSGAISIVLARKFPHLKIIATDICDTPLQVSEKNIRHFALEKQITLRKSNLIDEVSESLGLVVSNPPYIANNVVLESHVVDYEPKEALFAGSDGDELLKQIIVDVKAKGCPYLACEMGYDQKAPIQAFVNEIGVKSIQFYQDLAGIDRGFLIDFGTDTEGE